MLAIDVAADVGTFELRVNLPAADGTTVVVGPNGAGKSTLLKCLLGAVRPKRGEIHLGSAALFCDRTRINVPMEHRQLGFVPQKYALFPHLSVGQNVGFGIRGVTKQERDARVDALLEDLGISHLAKRRPPTLSGGESQRVALARAMAIGPRALLLDEPTAALDAGARKKVRRFLAERLDAVDIPTVVVSHDVDDVEALGGRVAVLENGRVVQVGTLEALRARPATEFVDEFLRGEARPPVKRRPLLEVVG